MSAPGTIFSATYAANYQLTASSQNPFTIAPASTIGGSGGFAALYAYGLSGYNWTISNFGDITGTGISGIQLGSATSNAGGGFITNQTGAVISGDAYGIQIFSTTGLQSYILNQSGASISAANATTGAAVYVLATGTVVNFGSITASTSHAGVYGIRLAVGGEVSNSSDGSIQAATGMYLAGGTFGAISTVINGGGIQGVTGEGVQIGKSGTNAGAGFVTNQSGGAISGGIYGIQIFSNLGLPSYVLNQSGASISAANATTGAAVYVLSIATVVNFGSITASTSHSGVYGIRLATGGEVSNNSGGSIQAGTGVYLAAGTFGSVSTFINAGWIYGAVGDGVRIGKSGTNVVGEFVTNQVGGTIVGARFGLQIFSGSPGSVVNQQLATISAQNTAAGAGVYVANPGTITNYGTIAASALPGNANSFGVHFNTGGDLINAQMGAAANIQGYVGVYLGAYRVTTASTLVNGGTITGVYGDGVQLGDSAYETASGSVTNQVGGTIIGNIFAVQLYNAAASYVGNQPSATITSTDTGGGGGVFLLNPGTVINGGVISTPTASGSDGLKLENGGLVTNLSSGTIRSFTGVYIGQAGVSIEASVIVNSGQLLATGNAIQLGSAGTFIQSGTVTNVGGGSIAGGNYAIGIFNVGSSYILNQPAATISATNTIAGDAIYMLNPGSVGNHGVITAPMGRAKESGVWLPNGGLVSNYGNSTIQGNRGIYIGSGGSLTNASTVANYGTIIAAGNDDAVFFGTGASASRLIVGPSAAFTGSIVGGGGALELAEAASAASFYGFGTTVTNFGSVAFDSTNWIIGGIEAALDTMTITGFVAGNTIAVDDFAATSASFTSSGTLTLTDTVNSTSMVLTVNGAAGRPVSIITNGGTTDITECFAAGTRIATPDGEIAVEDLASGDFVLTHFAGIAPIQWIGHRHVDCTRHPNPETVWPVRVSAGAFGANLPCRDLLLSPNHAVFVDDELIPVQHLINGLSVVQTPVDAVTYYHIELVEHDLLLAEAQPAESYLDVGDRRNFANGGQPVILHPDFSSRPPDVAAEWEMRGCAPLLLRGPRLRAVRRRVDSLAGVMAVTLAA